jgi:asparagine synthase (glutamine-hydrolysing)
MCGILAWFRPEGHRDTEERFREATHSLAHRGPDGSGFHFDWPAALGHRRLSIIDLGGGAQPIFNEDRSLAVTYNGEIYNFDEPRAELLDLGHEFRTKSDTEVIVHAYEQWGPDCLARFNGMFAFALWDARRQTLWVARDRLGVKPLYYWTDGRQFACASEIKALLKLGVVKAELNERVLDAYFSLGYVPGPETIFKGVRKLAPGHHLLVSEKGIQETCYWDFAGIEPASLTEAEATERLGALLQDCVRKCLVSDVPLGVFLSGGLDSSAVVAMMHGCGVDPVNSFTVGYDGRAAESEDGFARTVAARFRTRHHLFTLQPEDFFASLRTLIEHTEEPIVEPAAIALYQLSKLARQEVTVLLSGEGSDEILGGYSLYRVMSRLNRWQGALPPSLWKLLLPLGGLLPLDKHRKYLDWLAQPLEQRYQGTSAFLTPSLKQRLYTPEFLARRGSYLEEVFATHFSRASHRPDTLGKMLYVDTKTWLVDDLLVKADKMTMAASVELRVPFLDHRLVEFATSLPGALKVRDGDGKWILKRAMETKLPSEIVWRAKMGFPVPVRRWFGGELLPRIEETLMGSNHLPWVSRTEVRRLLTAQAQGREDHSKLIMSLLVLHAWREGAF